ncbi:hypothetical protein [Methanoculleus sp.]|uniref:hypothetical protein n=1 Tax=Methanoculleus sp. TaxID=90427 RepID=UPI00261F8565|nr:hypothetical protein [Methanoculleus sp.]MDI6867664.1 hypothetical protein [Methanoculleus sp.]
MLPSEVASRLIEQIYPVRPGLKLPKTAIHKILFKVRVALRRKIARESNSSSTGIDTARNPGLSNPQLTP